MLLPRGQTGTAWRSTHVQHHGFLAASYALLGDSNAAAAHVSRIRELDRAFGLKQFLATMHYAREQEGLQKAGYADSA